VDAVFKEHNVFIVKVHVIKVGKVASYKQKKKGKWEQVMENGQLEIWISEREGLPRLANGNRSHGKRKYSRTEGRKSNS
jgi:hypothetical protein